MIHYRHKIGLFKLNKPLNNNNILAVLLLNKPILWDKKELQMIILFSCSDNNNYIYNTISNTLMNLSLKEKDIQNLFEDSSYPLFLKTMIQNQS